ncbi:MAG: hypothetical protein VYB35_05495 [Verrucomicrobiota bacterium]|nr:hypothetical protein [Verrucomicrobiota bacterium]
MNLLLSTLFMLFSLCFCLVVAEDSDGKPFVAYDEPVASYLSRIQKGKQKFAFDPSLDFPKWQKEARGSLVKLIGLEQMRNELVDFKSNVLIPPAESVDGAYTRQLCVIETEPGIRVPFYYLVPIRSKKGQLFPLFISPHGHDKYGLHSYSGAFKNEQHRNEILAREGNIAEQAVLRGFVSIAPATRGLANELLVPDPKGRHGKRPCRAQLIHCLLSGRTPIGERIWDVQRILDWALKQPKVDPKNVVMAGNSGGGVVTAYVAAIDLRVTVAVPSCSFTSSISSEGYIFHCDCCLVPGFRNWGDWKELAGLIAPRRLLLVHGVRDGLHHRSTVEGLSDEVQNIFKFAGVPNHMELKWGNSGHRFYPQLMWPFIGQSFN